MFKLRRGMGFLKKRKAFALMIVISTIAVISSVIIGFSLLSITDKKKIRNLTNSYASVARQNALLGLHEAIAKLQVLSGPDQTVTASADILENAHTDKKYWIGTWAVEPADTTSPSSSDTKTFLGWLTSGDQNTIDNISTAIAESDRISILPELIYDGIDPVYAELVDAIDSNNKKIGRYAYWIDDQSLKAQCNLYNPGNSYKNLFSEDLYSADYSWFLNRQLQNTNALSLSENGSNFPLTQTYLQNNPSVVAECNYSNLLACSSFSTEDLASLTTNFHDFSCLSLGLLTDTRKGGFRKNLQGLSGTYLSEIPDNAFIFAPPTTFPAPPTTWGYLKSFRNLAADISGTSITPRPIYPLYRPQAGVSYGDCSLSTSTDSNGYITGTITGTHAADLGIATQYGIYPIFVSFKTYIITYPYGGYTPTNSSSTGGGYYHSLRMQPGFYLENPYPYNLASGSLKLWHCSPYVDSPEDGHTEKFQKQPTFRCKIIHNVSGVATTTSDGLLQGYVNSLNDGDKIFPFLSNSPNQYMRPIWDGIITTTFPLNTSRYIALNSHTSYLNATSPKSLITTTSSDPQTYRVNDIRFYQATDYKNIVSNQSEINSTVCSEANAAPWIAAGISEDPWSPFCMRSMDTSSNIFQQISDVDMKYESRDQDRNFSILNVESRQTEMIPVWEICAGLRHSSSIDSNFWHQYDPSSGGVRPMIEQNPRAPISCRTAHQDDMTNISYSGNFISGNWGWNAHWMGLTNANGTSYGRTTHVPFEDYSEFRYLFDLPHPTYKFLNLAFLQHMNVGCFSYHPSYAFGNSYQNPWIAREKYFQGNDTVSGSVWPSHHRVEMLYDYSYCLNRELWDSYFIPSYTSNNYFLFHRHKAFLNATSTELTSFENAAQWMSIMGSFNVNSTSVNAWEAFLGSAAGAISGNTDCAEFSRLQSIESTTHLGVVQLTQAQIKTLAEKLVEQIKKRGVASGIGEFVNRKLISKASDTDGLGLKGALQAAIDNSSINSAFSAETVTSTRSKDWFDDSAASGDFWACQPGYLTQADVLQAVSAPLCARGDTFVIHTYGNAVDSSGEIQAEAWCEAVVQRTPELYNSDQAELGRKYKILSIKWINAPAQAESEESFFSELYADNFGNITDYFNRKEAARAGGNAAWGVNHSCDEYWVIANLAENLGLAITNFVTSLASTDIASALASLASSLNSKLTEYTIKTEYAQAMNLANTGTFNANTWNAYQTLTNLLNGTASVEDVQSAVQAAYSSISTQINTSSSNQQEFATAVDMLQSTAETAGTVDNQTYYTQGWDQSRLDVRSTGSQAAFSILGLGAIEQFLNEYQDYL